MWASIGHMDVYLTKRMGRVVQIPIKLTQHFNLSFVTFFGEVFCL